MAVIIDQFDELFHLPFLEIYFYHAIIELEGVDVFENFIIALRLRSLHPKIIILEPFSVGSQRRKQLLPEPRNIRNTLFLVDIISPQF